MKKTFELTQEVKDLLYPLEAKIKSETNIGVFTKEEQAVLISAFHEINGYIPSLNCSSCFKPIKKSLTNWLNMYPKPVEETFEEQKAKVIEEIEEEFIFSEPKIKPLAKPKRARKKTKR